MPGSQLNADLWISEYISPLDVYQHGIEEILLAKKTAYQQMNIVRSGANGKALVLDGKWQSCMGDEFLYHEPLVQIACAFHRQPQSVLVLGGGEGATVREALRWNSVKRVVMVDIDGQVVEACREHLPEMHQGAFDDPRTELIIGDALDYLDEQPDGGFDIIISDLSDPIDQGPSFKLFTKEYFHKCRRVLEPAGYFVVQAGPLAPTEMAMHVRLAKTVASVFENIVSYGSHVPSYASPWGFVLGTSQPIDLQPDPAAIDALLAKHTSGGLRMFDGITMLGLLNGPKHIRQAIDAENEVYTLAQPPQFFGQSVDGVKRHVAKRCGHRGKHADPNHK
jgi:spermidine synthase